MSHRVAPGLDQPCQVCEYQISVVSLWGGGFLKIDLFNLDFCFVGRFPPAKNSKKPFPPDKMSLNGSPGMKKHEGPADQLQARDWAEIGMICRGFC